MLLSREFCECRLFSKIAENIKFEFSVAYCTRKKTFKKIFRKQLCVYSGEAVLF